MNVAPERSATAHQLVVRFDRTDSHADAAVTYRGPSMRKPEPASAGSVGVQGNARSSESFDGAELIGAKDVPAAAPGRRAAVTVIAPIGRGGSTGPRLGTCSDSTVGSPYQLRSSKRPPATATQPLSRVHAQRHDPIYGYVYTQPWRSDAALQAVPVQLHAGVASR